MAGEIIVLEGSYQFGNNIGVFQDATYVGFEMHLPIHVSWINDQVSEVTFIFKTHDIETWADWQKHEVWIGNTSLGSFRDNQNSGGTHEVFHFALDRQQAETIMPAGSNVILKIITGYDQAQPGMSDDFVLTRIDTRDIAIQIGWR